MTRREFLALTAAMPMVPAVDAPWRALFDGKSLGPWKPTNFGGEGDVAVEDGQIVLATGNDLTGITYTGRDLPTTNYEFALQAMRLSGIDFFCGLTFPVGSSFCSFIAGGWSGTVIGLSSIDNRDASENETTLHRNLDDGRWYSIRVRVEADRIQAWLDDEQVVNVTTTGHKIGIRAELADSRPLGIAAWRTRAALKDLRIRLL